MRGSLCDSFGSKPAAYIRRDSNSIKKGTDLTNQFPSLPRAASEFGRKNQLNARAACLTSISAWLAQLGSFLTAYEMLRARYFALASATVVSSIRFEKPHSLSYQLDTFTRRPDTFVSVASNVEDAGL